MPPRQNQEKSQPRNASTTRQTARSQAEGPGQLTLYDVRLIFRNFSGAARPFNKAGDRNFNVIIPEDLASQLIQDGWNVKWKDPRYEDETGIWVLKVLVKYTAQDGRKLRPPRVVLISSRGRTTLDESMISLLDWARIEMCDLMINPRWFDVNGKQGYTAYLHAIYVTIEEDELELKYIDVPDSAQSIVLGNPEEDPPF
jgi:hypothetical protein